MRIIRSQTVTPYGSTRIDCKWGAKPLGVNWYEESQLLVLHYEENDQAHDGAHINVFCTGGMVPFDTDHGVEYLGLVLPYGERSEVYVYTSKEAR